MTLIKTPFLERLSVPRLETGIYIVKIATISCKIVEPFEKIRLFGHGTPLPPIATLKSVGKVANC